MKNTVWYSNLNAYGLRRIECSTCGASFAPESAFGSTCDMCHEREQEETEQLTIKEISDSYFEAYEHAQDTDDAYSQAVRTQFGAKYNRWDFHTSAYNADTFRAFTAKKLADSHMDMALKAYRDMLKHQY